jgi:hypothetical protein
MGLGADGAFRALAVLRKACPAFRGLDTVSVAESPRLWRAEGARIGGFANGRMAWETDSPAPARSAGHQALSLLACRLLETDRLLLSVVALFQSHQARRESSGEYRGGGAPPRPHRPGATPSRTPAGAVRTRSRP